MPSSHSATVTALAVAVGLQEGFASSLFATAAVFASVVGSPLPFDTKNALTIFGRRWI
jgi:acid phosphatase family membrane protein YuiD